MGERTGGKPAIRTRALTKRYGRKTALAGIDLEVPRNVVFGYLPGDFVVAVAVIVAATPVSDRRDIRTL